MQNEKPFNDPQAQLRFSADTVFFDTVFTAIKTVTRRVRVYNDHAGMLTINTIALADPNTPFTLAVNGLPGTKFEETQLLGGDSLLILIEAKIDPQDKELPYVVEDEIQFLTNGNLQDVSIVAWGQDANFLRDSILVGNTIWTAGKPYVIYDHILVDTLSTLTLEKGTRVFSHINSGIFIKGKLMVHGTAADKVIFSNDRFDPPFDLAAGQWNGITFLPGSENNEITYAQLTNATNGIWLGTPDENTIPDLSIYNTIIENMSQNGVIAFSSDLTIENSLINNCGQFVLAGLAGGNYNLAHNTFVNYALGLYKQQPVMVVTDNLELADGSSISDPVNLDLINNIIWGPDKGELEFLNDAGMNFEVLMQNNIIKSDNLDFDVNNNLLNTDPLFQDIWSFNYQIDSLSPAINAGVNIGVVVDLNDSLRSNPPAIGAYEYY